MTKPALTLLLFALAANAHAAGSTPSLFHCGIKLGGSSPVYQADFASKNAKTKRDARVARVSGLPAETSDLRIRTFTASLPATARDSDRRMPAIVTLAKVGCSWR